MIFNIYMIINTIVCGFIFLIFGLEEKTKWKVLLGSALVSIGIIMNTISYFCGG